VCCLQGMVVSLASDKGVWDAVLANEKIKEFRRNFSAPMSEGTPVNTTFLLHRTLYALSATTWFSAIGI
jgi:hypothetical protein